MTICYYHVTYELQSESALYIWPERQGTPWYKQAPSLTFEWQQSNLSNHWVVLWVLICTFHSIVCSYHITYAHFRVNPHSRTQNHLGCVAGTYLYGALDYIFFSRNVRISEWIHTLQLPQCQATPASKKMRNPKFNWLQLGSNQQQLKLYCEYLSARCIWLYILIMSRTHFRVHPHSIVQSISRNS